MCWLITTINATPPDLTSDFTSNPLIVPLPPGWSSCSLPKLIVIGQLMYFWSLIGWFGAAIPLFPLFNWPTVVADENWGAMWEVGQMGSCQFCSSSGRTVDKHACTHCSWYGFNPLPTGIPVSARHTYSHKHMHIQLTPLWCRLAPGGLLFCALELLEALNLN